MIMCFDVDVLVLMIYAAMTFENALFRNARMVTGKQLVVEMIVVTGFMRFSACRSVSEGRKPGSYCMGGTGTLRVQ
jgi:hypothetical protein